MPKGSIPLQPAELDEGNRVNGWVTRTFSATPFSCLACWICTPPAVAACAGTPGSLCCLKGVSCPQQRNPCPWRVPSSQLGTAFGGVSPSPAKAAAKARTQMLLPVSNLIFFAWFQHANSQSRSVIFPHCEILLGFKTIPSSPANDFILLIHVFLACHPRRQGLSYAVICKWDHSALAGSVLPTPAPRVWWGSGQG